MPPKKQQEEQRKLTRIAIVNADKCKPKKCNLECKKACPINSQGRLCIEVEAKSVITKISEDLCIGCALCAKRCPFQALQIINLPSNLDQETTHRYGPNSFKLHRLPLPRPGKVLGLVGANGTGKSTALQILQGKVKPNLGNYTTEPTWEDILKHFRGSEHQAYFQRLLEDNVRAVVKLQFVDQVKRALTGTVRENLMQQDERKMFDHFAKELELEHVLDRDVKDLSGGELQRFTIALTCVQQADVYMYDEPSSYLDVKQRLCAANLIRKMLKPENYVITVEHDLAVVDYMSDYVCVLYGVPGVYGVVTLPYGVREGINVFLEGFVPTENLRFREESLTFRIQDDLEDRGKRASRAQWPKLEKRLGDFHLTVQPGDFSDSEIIVLMGQNGCGKTTLIRLLCGHLKPDNGAAVPQLSVSYKPQIIQARFEGSVKDLLQTKILDALNHAQFQTDVLRPLKIEELYDKEVLKLSGGEVQRVAITLALGTPANVYLLDEPSAYLDSDQRIIASRVIKRFILHGKKTAFVVEHDFIMATYLADKVIVYDGQPGVDCTALPPQPLLEGMNKFLHDIEVTFRRDPTNFRPRINKRGSVKDRMQKERGQYFYMAEDLGAEKAAAAEEEDEDE